MIYVLWAFWGVIYSVGTNALDFIRMNSSLPALVYASAACLGLVLAFYGYYSIVLIKLLARKPGIIRKIKALIFSTPIFNALLPLIYLGIVAAIKPELTEAVSLLDIYTPSVIGTLAGSAIMAVIWYRYFCVSRRVRAIWPQG